MCGTLRVDPSVCVCGCVCVWSLIRVEPHVWSHTCVEPEVRGTSSPNRLCLRGSYLFVSKQVDARSFSGGGPRHSPDCPALSCCPALSAAAQCSKLLGLPRLPSCPGCPAARLARLPVLPSCPVAWSPGCPGCPVAQGQAMSSNANHCKAKPGVAKQG